MSKWLSNVAGNKRSLVPSTIITLVIVAMLVLSGPAQAVAVNIIGQEGPYTKGDDIEFQVKIDINDPDQYVSITNISLDLAGPVNKTVYFTLNGTRISGDCNIEITPVSIPKDDFGVGYGYGYNTAGYGYDLGYGYGYGYGYGSGGGEISFIYNVTIHTDGTTCLPAENFPLGNYSVVASLNTGKNVVFQSSQFNFELEPSNIINILNASVEIKPETLNLASKGVFTAFITSKEFDIEQINGSTVRVIVSNGFNSTPAINWNTADKKFIAKFRTQDLKDVHTGDEVEFTVTGELFNGTKFEGSDSIKVIDKANGQKGEVEEDDDHIKEHDHEDECDNQCDDQDHSSSKNINNGQKNKNNGVQVNIYDNSGTVNVNVNNHGRDIVVSQGNSKNQGDHGKSKSQSNTKGKK